MKGEVWLLIDKTHFVIYSIEQRCLNDFAKDALKKFPKTTLIQLQLQTQHFEDQIFTWNKINNQWFLNKELTNL